MPRYFGSEAEMLAGIKGYRARTNYTAARNEARAAELSSPEYAERMRHAAVLREDSRLSDVVFAAEQHVAKLQGKLTLARSQAASLSDRAYMTGDIHSDAAVVRRQIDGLPALIARAEQELSAARDALAAHRARSTPVAEPVPSDPSPEADPVDAAEAKRGPGRPKKVPA